MKIAMLAPANSIHTQRWVLGLAARGHEVTLYSQHPEDFVPPETRNVRLQWLPFRGLKGYLLNAAPLRAHLLLSRADVLHAHYASGYGTLGSLTGHPRSLLSVWGSDVYDFPYESELKGLLIRRTLRWAPRIASTSQVMADQVQRLVPGVTRPFITPFGVDCERFRPSAHPAVDRIHIGTVKTLAAKYGIDVLIAAFAKLLGDTELTNLNLADRLHLTLVGGGEDRARLENQVTSLGLNGRVTFVGFVAHAEVPSWLNRLDVYVAPSRLDSESFGVAAIEASACGVPVVVSDAGGLPEVVRDGVTGFVVPRENAEALAAAIKRLVLDGELRRRMGQAGREHVLKHYAWERCLDTMEALYREVAEGPSS